MSKTIFYLMGSTIYFGLAVFAVKQMQPDGHYTHFLAQLLTGCAFVDLFGMALLVQPKGAHRGLLTPKRHRRVAKTLRFLAGVLTVPVLMFWATGEVLLQPSGTLKHWTQSVITFSKIKQHLEGASAARDYLTRAACASAHVAEGYERKNQLLEAYEYYFCYAELLKRTIISF